MYTYAPHQFEANDVLDVRRLNEVFAAVADKIAGGLDETAWADNFITDVAAYAEEMFGSYKQVTQATDPFVPGSDVLEHTKTWKATNFTMTFNARGGMTVIEASWQFANDPGAGTHTAGESPGSAMFAIRVDGAVQAGSVIGTGDWGNDVQLDHNGVQWQLDPSASPVFMVPKHVGGTGPAIRANMTPLATGCALRLAPGDHTIELVYKNPIIAEEVEQSAVNGEIYAIEFNA